MDKLTINSPTTLCVPNYDEEVDVGLIYHIAYPVVAASTNGEAPAELVVATTRPETIPGDVAVAIHPDDPRYARLHGASVQHPLTGHHLPIILDTELVDLSIGTAAVKITPGKRSIYLSFATLPC